MLMAALLALFGAGCAQTYYFKVDALADPSARSGQTFALESGFADKPGATLRFRETADFVDRALRARGYQPTDVEAADLIITVQANLSGPLSDTEVRSSPVYYRTWGQSQIIRTPVRDANGQVRYVATRIYLPPETRFAGYRETERSIIVYEKSLDLTARTPDGVEVWTVSVRTVDRDSDLRAAIPYLAAAAMPYLGEVTEGAVVVKVDEGDETVSYLRGMRETPQ